MRSSSPRWYRVAIAGIRAGPLGGSWLFAWIFLAQLGHLVEHISMAVQGRGLLGATFDSELSHLLFNTAIAVLAMTLVCVYPGNPWVYPLVVLSVFHDAEHAYIFRQHLQTGIVNGPGLLGNGGLIGLVPLDRLDLHNLYNALEIVLMTCGLVDELPFNKE